MKEQAGPVANLKTIVTYIKAEARAGSIESQTQCDTANLIIGTYNQAALKYPSLADPVVPLDCKVAMARTTDRVTTELSTEEAKVVTAMPPRGHMSGQCAACLNLVSHYALRFKRSDPESESVFNLGCNARLEPRFDPETCESLSYLVRRASGDLGGASKTDLPYVTTPQSQIGVNHLVKIFKNPEEKRKYGLKETTLRVPAAECVAAGFCNREAIGLKSGMHIPIATDANPVQSKVFLGKDAFDKKGLVPIVTKKGEPSGEGTIVDTDKVSITVPADVVFTMASKQSGRCLKIGDISKYSAAPKSGIFGKLGSVIRGAHVVFERRRGDAGDYDVTVDENPKTPSQSLWQPTKLPKHQGTVSVLHGNQIATTAPLTCHRDPKGSVFPQLHSASMRNTEFTAIINTGYASSHGERHVKQAPILSKDGKGSHLTCMHAILSSDDAKRVREALFPAPTKVRMPFEKTKTKLSEQLSAKDLDYG